MNIGSLSAKEVYGSLDYKAKKIYPPLNNFQNNGYQYEQTIVSNMCCTACAGLTAISNQLGLSCNEQNDLATIWKNCKDRGSSDEKGGYIYIAVDETRKYLNKLGYNITTEQLTLGSDLFEEALDNGYLVHTGFFASREFVDDLLEDGDIDKMSFSGKTWGHSICIFKKDGDYFIVDNYPETNLKEKNVYKLNNFAKLLENGVFFKYGYIYIDNKTRDDVIYQMFRTTIKNLKKFTKSYELWKILKNTLPSSIFKLYDKAYKQYYLRDKNKAYKGK